MDDITICKKIAEIEGYLFGTTHGTPVIVFNQDDVQSYNPLTDDALCFQLFKRHNVNVNSHPQSPSAKWYTCQSIKNGKVSMCNEGFSNLKGDSDNKAICLAIIEAHKEL
tara:strand:- start:48 stop:377 length:330 start_codon:yes stop_codon:yes gene_type:complete